MLQQLPPLTVPKDTYYILVYLLKVFLCGHLTCYYERVEEVDLIFSSSPLSFSPFSLFIVQNYVPFHYLLPS